MIKRSGSSPNHVSLADVAAAAGVSLATASRALSDSYGVAESTKVKVQQAAARLDYVTSPEAAQLASGSTGRVAVVVPHIERWFFGEMLSGIEAVLNDADVDVLLYHVDDADDRREFLKRLPARRKVDGLIVLAFPVDESEQRRLELMGVAIVAAGGQNAAYPNVHIDDNSAGRQALDHLIYLGHRRIGMIAAADPDQPDLVTEGRFQAYYDAMADAGIEVDPALVATVPWGGEEGATAMARLLSNRVPPTAVFAHSDEVAFGAMRTLRRAGLRIPEDISIIGVDDHPHAALLDLTTVRQPVREQGQLSAQMLLDILAGRQVEPTIAVPTHLVIRGSTAPPRS